MEASSSYYTSSGGSSSRKKQYESPDPYNGDSSRYSTHHSGGSGSGHRKHKRRSRSRSGSPDRKSSRSIFPNAKTANEYEVRIHALSTQLAMANSQILTFESEVNTAKNMKLQCDNRNIMLQHEITALQARNSEILKVMKTLETGVEALQKEKLELMATNDELNEKLENQGKMIEQLDEQISSLNDRNSTLSKKCVDMVGGSRETKEKAEKYEIELLKLRPQNEMLKKELETMTEDHKRLAMRVATFEMREKIWINEKSEMDRCVNEALGRAQRAEVGAKQQLQQKQPPAQSNSNDGSWRPPAAAKDNAIVQDAHVEVIKKFQLLLDSLQMHYRTELGRVKAKLKELEQRALQQEEEPTNPRSTSSTPPEAFAVKEENKSSSSSPEIKLSPNPCPSAFNELPKNNNDDVVVSPSPPPTSSSSTSSVVVVMEDIVTSLT